MVTERFKSGSRCSQFAREYLPNPWPEIVIATSIDHPFEDVIKYHRHFLLSRVSHRLHSGETFMMTIFSLNIIYDNIDNAKRYYIPDSLFKHKMAVFFLKYYYIYLWMLFWHPFQSNWHLLQINQLLPTNTGIFFSFLFFLFFLFFLWNVILDITQK